MGKKAKKAATEEEVEADVEDTVDEARDEETKPAAKKGRIKKAPAEEVPLDEEGAEPEEAAPDGDDKEIFEEKSEVAKQFEAAGEPKEEITEERTYVVPLSRAYASPRKYRAKKAVIILREFFKRHMKATDLVILPEVNDEIWSRSIERPPRKIKIRALKNIEGKVTLYLAMVAPTKEGGKK
ncbi:MAG: 60S ribosomal protein L31 [Candidatus Lokiarchaeota archaeon]|nr:60S ribosomal protein L31 [Candidatus Lokiarchaeota archaeon]